MNGEVIIEKKKGKKRLQRKGNPVLEVVLDSSLMMIGNNTFCLCVFLLHLNDAR